MTVNAGNHLHWEYRGQRANKAFLLAASLGSYALSGGVALLVLTLIEWIDLNLSSRVVLGSIWTRLELLAYSSLNVFVGLAIGLVLGVFVNVTTWIGKRVKRVLAAGARPRARHKLLIGFTVGVATAYMLNQQRDAHRYIIGVLREAEKIDFLREPILNREQSVSYLALLVLVSGCWLLWRLTRSTPSMSPIFRRIWLSSLVALLAAGYYIDTRIEAQLYEDTLHLSTYLFQVAVAFALTGSAYMSSTQMRFGWRAVKRRVRVTMTLCGFVMLAVLLSFCGSHFGGSQTLKVLVFYYTAVTRQSYKLAWWALDRDGDGYPALMGGGDADDHRADINPGQPEVAGDGIDNNCIGGELTQQDVATWKRGLSFSHAASVGTTTPLNVVYIFIDALRADHLGAYGYHRNVSPHIDALAARSCVFDNAFTPAPNTYEALPKFMQSSYWDGHFETWTEVLAQHGYDALLFPRRIMTLRRHVKGMTEAYQGKGGTLDYTIDRAIEILGNAGSGRPFCAYLYATDTHRPYRRHSDVDFGSSMIDRYDGEIAFLDSQFGRLFEWLETSGRLKNTAIVFMADHGESLGERGFYKHSSQLYNEQARVPLIIYAPGVTPRRISKYVSTIDLGVTIVNMAGFDGSKEWVGSSLWPLMMGEELDYPPVYAEQTTKQESPYVRPELSVHGESKKYMIITQDGYKLIYNRNYYAFELFDLKDDPGERVNLCDRLPEKALELKSLIGRYVDVVTASRPRDADESKYIFGKLGGDADDE